MNYSGNDFYCDVAFKGEIALKKEFESEHVHINSGEEI